MAHNNTPNHLKNQAHIYIENGWNIFPLTPFEKAPLASALVGGSQNSTLSAPLTEADVERIWLQHPNANIGVHTGAPSQIVVVDIDVAKNELEEAEGKRTPDQAEALMEQFVSVFGETQVNRSPSGGFHLLYRYTPICDGVGRKIDAFKGLKNVEQVELVDGMSPFDLRNIDILAGNGYVVAPPSQLEGGREYTTIYEMSAPLLPDFPNELLKLLSKRSKLTRTYFEMQEGLQKPITSDNAKEKKAQTVWDMGGKAKLIKKLKVLMGAGSGSRHDSLLKACGIVFHTLPYKEWDSAKEYIDMVISTFNPPYFQGDSTQVEADKREVLNAYHYARANEYVDRVQGEEKNKEQLDEKITKDIEIIKEIGGEIDADEYKAAVEAVYEAFQTDSQGNAISNDHNIAIVLKEHPKYKNRVRFNTFTEELTYKCKIGAKYGDHYLEDVKGNPAMARLVQDIQFDFFPKVPRGSVFAAAVSVGHDAEYDSYREQMDHLKGKWDGVERMDTWLQKVFKLPDDLYHRGVSAQFVFAMVRRAYEPGATFQTALFLSAEQGIGKSYSMRILSGDEGYLEFNDEVVGREFNLHAKGKTLIDLAEGESMRRSSVSRMKALISDNQGTHRTFGSGEVREHPVRYVICITNNNSPLVDTTGNRRFLVVKPINKRRDVGDVNWLKAFRTQIFAEAVHKYHEMKRMEVEVAEQIAELEATGLGGEQMYDLYKKSQLFSAYEMSLYDFKLTPELAMTTAHTKVFRSPYGVPYIPQEMAEEMQAKARMKSVVEEEIQAILNSYDEYRAEHEDFFISSQEIYNQISEEAIRQSRFGSFALAEASRVITVVDGRLDKSRHRKGQHRDLRGYKFVQTAPNADARLAAIKRIRERANAMRTTAPSSFGGGSKAVTTDQKSAKIRWEREGDAYVVIRDEDIDREMQRPESVEVSELVYSDNF